MLPLHSELALLDAGDLGRERERGTWTYTPCYMWCLFQIRAVIVIAGLLFYASFSWSWHLSQEFSVLQHVGLTFCLSSNVSSWTSAPSSSVVTLLSRKRRKWPSPVTLPVQNNYAGFVVCHLPVLRSNIHKQYLQMTRGTHSEVALYLMTTTNKACSVSKVPSNEHGRLRPLPFCVNVLCA